MTNTKILEVLELYKTRVKKALESSTWEGNSKLEHVLDMCQKTKEFTQSGRREKAFRWLGFIQGVLWCESIYTIAEMKKHNMPSRTEDQSPTTQ